MKDKSTIVMNYMNNIVATVTNLMNALAVLGEDAAVNTGAIKSADVIITSLNSQLVILQNELDNY